MKKYKILHLEDSPSDSDLVRHQLVKAELSFDYFLAKNEPDYLLGLKEFKPDIILSDHSLPQFNSLKAFEIFNKADLKIPFILVTGAVSEEYAVEAIKKGIDDYLLKSNLYRLGQVIQNALLKRENERKIKEAAMLRDFDRTNLLALINNTRDLIWSVDVNFKLITSNTPFDMMIKFIRGSALEKGKDVLTEGFADEHFYRWKNYYERAFLGETFTVLEVLPGIEENCSEISFYPIHQDNKIIGTSCFSHNILDKLKAEEKLKNQYLALKEITFMLSHTARAPIASVLGLISLLNLENINDPINIEVMQNIQKTTKLFDIALGGIIKSTAELNTV